MVIWITNYKGGVGKTMICQNLGVCLAKDDKKVCIIDTDTNQSSLTWFGIRNERLPDVPVFFAPNQKILVKILKVIKSNYDIILIDWTPSDIELTDRILKLSNILLIPVIPSESDIRVTEKFVSRVQEIQGHSNPFLSVRFIFNQMTYTNKSKELFSRISDLWFPTLSSFLKNKVAYKNAYEQGRGVVELKEKEMNQVYNELKEVIHKTQLLSVFRDF